MRIYWGIRFGLDAFLVYAIYTNFVSCIFFGNNNVDPKWIFHLDEVEEMQWGRRRRGFIGNPYFIKPEECKLQYDKYYNVIGVKENKLMKAEI